MKVIYEEDYAPFINYNVAYVYLDTEKEELSVTPDYTYDAHYGRDLVWDIPTGFARDAYNDLLDDIKPLAVELLKHHTIEENGYGYLDEDGKDVNYEIVHLIDEWPMGENRTVHVIAASPSEVRYYYSPWDVSPSQLKQIALERIDSDGDSEIYFDNEAEAFEIASMEIIGYAIENMNARKASEYLSHIYSVYEKDGFASDFEDVLLPFLEEEGYIEFIDGDWYLADTEDKIEWK